MYFVEKVRFKNVFLVWFVLLDLLYVSIYCGIVVLVCFVDLFYNSWFICFCFFLVMWYIVWVVVWFLVILYGFLVILCFNLVLFIESDRLKDIGVLLLVLCCV